MAGRHGAIRQIYPPALSVLLRYYVLHTEYHHATCIQSMKWCQPSKPSCLYTGCQHEWLGQLQEAKSRSLLTWFPMSIIFGSWHDNVMSLFRVAGL